MIKKYYEDLLKLLNSDEINNEKKVIIKVAYLFMKDESIECALGGAYSLYINDIIFGNKKTSARKISDLDFSIHSRENIVERLSNWALKNNLMIVKLKYTREENIKLILSVPSYWENNGELTLRLHIDVVFHDDFIPQYEVDYETMLARNLNLKLEQMDRRLKDLVDVVVNLRNFYPNGISKKQLISMIKNKRLLESAITKSNFDDCLSRANKFEPKIIAGFKVEDCVLEFFSMSEGLLDKSIEEKCLFKNGYWENP